MQPVSSKSLLEYHNPPGRRHVCAGIKLWFKVKFLLPYCGIGDMDAVEVQPSTPSGAVPSADAPATPKKKPSSKVAKAKAKASPKVPPTPMKAMKVKKTIKQAPKAKPVAAPAAKAKASAKKGMKRPAAAAVVVPVMKKPASASAVASSKSQGGAPSGAQGFEDEAALDHEGGEEETPEVDDEESVDRFEICNENRDRVKANKFKQLLAQGSLPAWCKKAWQATLEMRVGKVAAQTKLINNVLSREGGALKLQLDAPALSELKACMGGNYFVT